MTPYKAQCHYHDVTAFRFLHGGTEMHNLDLEILRLLPPAPVAVFQTGQIGNSVRIPPRYATSQAPIS